jgi:NAD(P)-dependent dehydrogenase (short-subunit alcohol dehydrogenase family)
MLATREKEQALAETIPLARVGEPDEIARPVLWLLSDEASFVSGAIINAGGGGFHVGKP